MAKVFVDTMAPTPPSMLEFLSQNSMALGLKASTRTVKRADYDVIMHVYENEAGDCFNYLQGVNHTTTIVYLVDSPVSVMPTWIMEIVDRYREVVRTWNENFTFWIEFKCEYDAANSSLAKSA